MLINGLVQGQQEELVTGGKHILDMMLIYARTVFAHEILLARCKVRNMYDRLSSILFKLPARLHVSLEQRSELRARAKCFQAGGSCLELS